jgi:hypothetical protein
MTWRDEPILGGVPNKAGSKRTEGFADIGDLVTDGVKFAIAERRAVSAPT